MKKEEYCPLCSSSEMTVIEEIKTKDLSLLWSMKRIDTKQIFKQVDILRKNKCSNCSLEFFNPLTPGDDNFYGELGNEEWYYLHKDKTEFAYSAKYIKDQDIILDIGSGRGVFSKYIDKDVNYTGLELSSKAVESASKDGINVIQESIESHCKNNKNKYNVVVAFQVLEHVSNVSSFLESSVNVIKQGGLLIIAVPNNNSFVQYSQNNILNLPPHHIFHWNRRSLEFVAKKYNLEVVDTYKERVTNVHRSWYYATCIQKYILNTFKMDVRSISVRISNIIIKQFSFVLSKCLILFKPYKKNGHTIVMVFKKK